MAFGKQQSWKVMQYWRSQLSCGFSNSTPLHVSTLRNVSSARDRYADTSLAQKRLFFFSFCPCTCAKVSRSSDWTYYIDEDDIELSGLPYSIAWVSGWQLRVSVLWFLHLGMSTGPLEKTIPAGSLTLHPDGGLGGPWDSTLSSSLLPSTCGAQCCLVCMWPPGRAKNT